jgi:hypothetical protein
MKDNVVGKIDRMASNLEAKGLVKEAYVLDVIANTLEGQPGDTPVTVGINDFVKRQTKSDFTGTKVSEVQLESLRKKAEQLAVSNQLKAGYAPFVKIAVMHDPGIMSPIVKVTPENQGLLKSEVTKRREFENEYEQRYFESGNIKGTPSNHVNVILYSREQLEKEPDGKPSGADWDMISINAEPYSTDSPMAPSTIRRNMQGMEAGGSGWQHKQEELVQSESFLKDHAMVK